MKNKGFSLLELLVVIGIISLLLAAAVSSYSTAQKKTRDARRQADLKTIQQAAEQYYSICGYTYPNFSAGVNAPIICTVDPTQIILPTDKIPKDPKGGTPYICSGTCNTSSFTLCAPQPELVTTICVSSQQ